MECRYGPTPHLLFFESTSSCHKSVGFVLTAVQGALSQCKCVTCGHAYCDEFTCIIFYRTKKCSKRCHRLNMKKFACAHCTVTIVYMDAAFIAKLFSPLICVRCMYHTTRISYSILFSMIVINFFVNLLWNYL
jgi:hypothetical protein